MATPAYVPIDPNAPAGATQAPDTYAASDLANVRALRDAIATGALPGWSYSQTAATARPPTREWASGVFRLRMTTTYGGAAPFLPTTVKWEWSNDSGASYSTIGAIANVTWDAARYTITAADANAGMWIPWLAADMKARLAQENFDAHAALTGNAVHGLGTLSTQNANAAAITGGSVSSATLNGCNLANSAISAAARAYPSAPTALVHNANFDWAARPTMVTAVPGNHIPGHVNHKAGEVKRIFVNGAGAIGLPTVMFSPPATWGANFTVVLLMAATDGGQVVGQTIPY